MKWCSLFVLHAKGLSNRKYNAGSIGEPKSDIRLRELDGWRAVSVLLVIVFHVWSFQFENRVPHILGVNRAINSGGDLGVKMFFVISGIVICRLLLSEESRYGSITMKSFYYRRIFRILPPLCVYVCAMVALLSFGLIHEQWSAILGSCFFLYDLNIPPWSWFVGHTWSLAVEEQFYLFFPWLLALLPKLWRSKFFLGMVFLFVTWNLAVSLGGWNPLLWNHARQGFACICCGVLIGLHEEHVRGMATRVPGFLVALTGLVLLERPLTSPDWLLTLYEGLFVPPAIGLLLLFSLRPAKRLGAFLCTPPLQAIGLTSYGIYLWQQLFTSPNEYFARSGQVIPFLAPLMFVIVPTSYWFVEKPAIRYGRSLSERARLVATYRNKRIDPPVQSTRHTYS